METDEELVDGASFAAWRRVLVLIHMPPDPRHPGRESTLSLEPGVLDEALARDRAASGPPPDAHPTPPPTGDDQMPPPTPDLSNPTAAEKARSGINPVPTAHQHLRSAHHPTGTTCGNTRRNPA